MLWITQSTEVVVQFGPFVDKTDKVTLEVGLAAAMNHAVTGIMISKAGAAQAVRGTLTLPVYDAMGCYRVRLSTADTGTLGILRMVFQDPSAESPPVSMDFVVVVP